MEVKGDLFRGLKVTFESLEEVDEVIKKYSYYLVDYHCSNCGAYFRLNYKVGEDAAEIVRCPRCGTKHGHKRTDL